MPSQALPCTMNPMSTFASTPAFTPTLVGLTEAHEKVARIERELGVLRALGLKPLNSAAELG